jgi:hypothetical protein
MFLHADTLRTSSWQMQIRGRKRWHLCPGPGGVQAAILTMECMVHGAWWAARCIHCMRALHDALRDALHDTLRDALHDTLRDTLHDTLRDTLRDALHCAALHALPHVTSPPAPSRDCITYLLHCSGRLAHVLRRGEARYLRPGLPRLQVSAAAYCTSLLCTYYALTMCTYYMHLLCTYHALAMHFAMHLPCTCYVLAAHSARRSALRGCWRLARLSTTQRTTGTR